MLSAKCLGGPHPYLQMEKELLDVLRSIDTSLQVLANVKTGGITTAFVSKKVISSRLGIPPIAVDRLIHQGIVSQGSSGLVEGGTIASLILRKPTQVIFCSIALKCFRMLGLRLQVTDYGY